MSQKLGEKLIKVIHGYCRMESNDMNVVDGIIAIIYAYYQIAIWSKKFKGESIELFDDDSKAMCTDKTKEGRSIRADFAINRGEIISWEFECYQTSYNSYFYGIVSSKQQDFNGYPASWKQTKINDAFGIDDYMNCIYLGQDALYIDHWTKPTLPYLKIFLLQMTADWRDGKQCKLSIFYNGEKLNDTNDEYTILCDELDDNHVWYPCVTPYNEGAYVIIRYLEK